MVVATVSACDLLGTFVVIENRASQELQVVRVISEDDSVIPRRPLDQVAVGNPAGNAREAYLTSIEDVNGNELLRHEGAFCTDDSPWTINDEMISTND